MSVSPGHVVAGKYRVLRKLGAGGMGTVYVATNLSTGVEVALKMIAEGIATDPAAARRFMQEARATGSIRHQGIVRVFDAGADPLGLWMAMELLSGESLADRLLRGPLTYSELALYASELVEILKHVHDAGVVHRDLKPANIFIEELSRQRRQVRILDFGIAKLEKDFLKTFATRTNVAMGTPHYLAPEQARHAKGVDHRADIYSLGVVLYECIAGELPYDANSFGELVAKMHSETPKPLRAPPEFRAFSLVAMACLALEPARRPQSCDAVASMLAQPLRRDRAADPARPVPWRRVKQLGIVAGLVASSAFVLTALKEEPNDQRALVMAPAAFTPKPPTTMNASAATPAAVRVDVTESRRQKTEVRNGEPLLSGSVNNSNPPDAGASATTIVEPLYRPDALILTRAFRKQHARIEACFSAHAVAVEGLAQMQVEFDLAADGRVDGARVVPTALAKTPLGRCLEQVASSTRFGPQGRAVSFAIPMTASRPASRPAPPPAAATEAIGTAEEIIAAETQVAEELDEEMIAANEGELLISSIPWSHVYVDGEDTNRDTPVRALRVSPGAHKIGLRTPDDVLHTIDVIVEAGQVVRIIRRF